MRNIIKVNIRLSTVGIADISIESPVEDFMDDFEDEISYDDKAHYGSEDPDDEGILYDNLD